MAFTTSSDSVALESLVGPMMLDVPYPIAEQALRWSAIEFCERTRCWANRLVRPVAAGAAKVSLFPADEAVITDITEVRWAGVLLSPVSRVAAEALRVESVGSPPLGYFRSDPETLVLSPVPSEAGEVSALLALTPTREAREIPRFLVDLYGEAVEQGARARLLAMAHRPWGNPSLGEFYRQQFELQVARVAIQSDKEGTRLPLRSALNF